MTASVRDLWRDARTQQFRRAVTRLREMALEIDELRALFDDSATQCETCDAPHFRNPDQRDVWSKIGNTAISMRAQADRIELAARRPDFIGEPAPGTTTVEVGSHPLPSVRAANNALDFALNYGQIDGGHHKLWVIDQMVRALTDDGYDAWVKSYEQNGEYEWETGQPP